ncbi:MAG: formate dehydrogenase family accessory protein FdhD [Desulfobacca sp. 4484_104]|nr:MAG: formate dehydrogenase family accessory protein FdhD [Desulfobacca sp. 4484_104]RLA87917.1 MAG: formate dehydrogenase accessory sulfurtransferase FdhD [Deltaproteobacteria bacterium]
MSGRIAKAKVLKYSASQLSTAEEVVAAEQLLAIRIDGEFYQDFLCLPGQEQDLALGWLFTAGVIDGIEDIRAINFCAAEPQADRPWACVEVGLRAATQARGSDGDLPMRVLKGLGGGQKSSAELLSRLPSVNFEPRISAPILTALMAKLPQRQEVFRQTGATHAIAIASVQGEVIFSAEDVGRHNALDKVIGRALREGLSLTDKIALLSGRVSYEMLFKAVRAGIPILASVSAPTHLAIRLAEQWGLTLAGFVRGRRMNIYSHPERLTDLVPGGSAL